MTHKAGYVNIIGRPNVGKSTLMNQLVGEKISIITSKAQTTRHRILGIVNGDDFQIVFSDTPGIIKDPAYKMHEVMNQFVNVALIDADLILFVVDITDKKIEEKTVERLKTTEIPVLYSSTRLTFPRRNKSSRPWNNGAKLCPTRQFFRFRHNMAPMWSSSSSKSWKSCLNVRPISPRTNSPTARCASSSPKSSARRFCSTTSRKSPTLCKSKWKVTRKPNTASISAASFTWLATHKKLSSSAKAAAPLKSSECKLALILRSLRERRFSLNFS
ncbi:MAG: 50S ribosome-binding GTPase [Bacteroidales bacterium]|nr:50S ribosome-binding GTPase [Bacteroidales bacterium]